jgi:hypothetical protein
MRSFFFIRLVALSILVVVATDLGQAQGRFGFGVMFGDPTGFAWKYRIDGVHALDGGIGFSPFDRFRIHVDYLWNAHPFETKELSLHYGLGGVIGAGLTGHPFSPFRDPDDVDGVSTGLAARGVVGLTYFIPRSPVDLFLEIAPLLVFGPVPGFGFDGSFGVRVYP